MKITEKDGKLRVEGKNFSLCGIEAAFFADGRRFELRGADIDDNEASISADLDGIKAEWSVKVFEGAARIRFEIEGAGEISKMQPFSAWIENADGLKILKVPFDNDDWVKYGVSDFKEGGRSYGVSAVYDRSRAISIGAADYSVWKTGIDFDGKMTVTAGIADKLTRDACGHGTILKSAKAPEIWIFEADSKEEAMRLFAEKYGEINKRLEWRGESARGWNSWYAYMKDIDAPKYKSAVDFVAGLDNMRGAYVNFDAFWTNLNESELLSCAEYARSRGLVPGVYLAPFATWIEDERLDSPVTGETGEIMDENIKWRDILLKDYNGNILPRLDGGYSIDMTHPTAIKRAEDALRYLKRLGYKYIKLDFLGHGAREGAFYDSSVRTGLMCYNAAMKRIREIWSDDDMFLSLSIAPVFPGGTGHARRVCCDVFGEFKDSKYLLNSLTYGWWLNKNVYEYNDPDHICFDKGDAEAKFRFISGLIGGTVFLLSMKPSVKDECKRVRELTNNAELMRIADMHITFLPLTEYIEEDYAQVFKASRGADGYIAAFNFSDVPRSFEIPVKSAGEAKDLCSGIIFKYDKAVKITLGSKDCTIIRILNYSRAD